MFSAVVVLKAIFSFLVCRPPCRPHACGSDELGMELEIWEYGTGQELEESTDALPDVEDERWAFNQVSCTEHEAW